MPYASSDSHSPVLVSASTEAQTYLLFALAMIMTVVGVAVGSVFASVLLGTGVLLLLVFLEFGIIISSTFWAEKSPLNMVLFILFPLLSGITVTPYLMMVLLGYANGASILLNALASTAFMALAAAAAARMTNLNFGVFARTLFFALFGLIGFSLLQLFVPALRTTGMDLLISGVGIVVFALFTAYDLQRIQAMSRVGASPFLMAIRLYLDIFNLFLYVLRFMTSFSGRRN